MPNHAFNTDWAYALCVWAEEIRKNTMSAHDFAVDFRDGGLLHNRITAGLVSEGVCDIAEARQAADAIVRKMTRIADALQDVARLAVSLDADVKARYIEPIEGERLNGPNTTRGLYVD